VLESALEQALDQAHQLALGLMHRWVWAVTLPLGLERWVQPELAAEPANRQALEQQEVLHQIRALPPSNWRIRNKWGR
jgi:hypothetical protein